MPHILIWWTATRVPWARHGQRHDICVGPEEGYERTNVSYPDPCSSKAQIMHGARWLMHPLRQLRCVLFLKHLHALLSNGLMESWNSEVQ